MSTKKNIALSGALALAVAAIVIASTILSGISPLPSTQSNLASNPSTSGTGQGSTTKLAAPTGTLSILLTDPPQVPDGVTKVYITYTSLAVHYHGPNDTGGWVELNEQGTIELLGTVNVGVTIAAANIQTGVYNGIKFNISSAEVTYNSKNYTAFVPTAQLKVPIIGGIRVNASKLSATIINIDPVVMNIGNTATPEFIIRAWAKAFAIPPGQVGAEAGHRGYHLELGTRNWWKHFQEQSAINLQISGASLTSSSLTVSVANTGNQSTSAKLVIITSLQMVRRAEHANHTVPIFWGSAIFLVMPSGTMQLVNATNRQEMEAFRTMLFSTQTGYNMTVGGSATLSYSGPVVLGFGLQPNLPFVLVPGDQYVLTVIGENAVASTTVVAH